MKYPCVTESIEILSEKKDSVLIFEKKNQRELLIWVIRNIMS